MRLQQSNPSRPSTLNAPSEHSSLILLGVLDVVADVILGMTRSVNGSDLQ